MVRILSKKTRTQRAIQDGLALGMSGNQIQKMLSNVGLGIQRKKLYEEIRSIKGETITKEKREKSIPKKYRKQESKKSMKKYGEIYRGSLIISSLPLHSTPFNRNYIGFRMNFFSIDKNEVKRAMNIYEKKFIEMVGDKVRSYMYGKESYETMGIESVVKIAVSNPENLNGKWFFAVESKGKDISSQEGYF